MIVEHWQTILFFVGLFAVACIGVYAFMRLSPEQQKAKIREWLLWAVIKAEREYGGGTGKLKLAFVYDLFLKQFPTMSRLMSFEKFSELVNKALERMRLILETNPKILSIVLKKEDYNE